MPLFRFPDKILFFIHIPKTGGSSVEAALRKMGGRQALLHGHKLDYSRCTLQHIHSEVYSKLIPRGFYDYAFCICRDPLSRLVSEYQMRQANSKISKTFDEWVSNTFHAYENNPYIFDNHIRPQSEFISENACIFRLEDGVDKVIEKISKITDRPAPRTPHKRNASYLPYFISQKTLEMIFHFYETDYTIFGYEKVCPENEVSHMEDGGFG